VLVADFRVLQHEIAALNGIVSGQASQNAEQTIQITKQTNQIADLQRSTEMIVDQNQQMQDQIRQMHALLMSREQEPPIDVDERGKRAVKRRRTGQ
jgi:hypothetical protein